MTTDWLTDRQRDGGIDRVPLPADVAGELRLCGKHAIGAGGFDRSDAPWDTVVCLCQRHEISTRYPTYANWLDESSDAEAVWWPIHDLGVQPLDRTLPFVDDLVARLRASNRLLVHCAAGIGRAGTTAVCILIRLGVPIDEALRTVAAARAMAGPEAGAQLALVRAVAAAS